MAAGGGKLGRILGLGFLFGAKDTGVGRTTSKIRDGLDRVSDGVDRVGKDTGGLLKFNNAMSVLQSFQLGHVIDSLDALGAKAGVGVAGQANQIESFGATFSQTFRQARAGMGAFGKELDKQKGKIAGTAFNLGVGAEELTNAVAEVTKTGSKLSDFGLDVRTLGGAIQSSILGTELPHVLTSLAKGYDLGAKGATKLLDKQVALGEAFGVGADAAKAMPEIIKAADPILAKFTNLKIDNVTESLTRLAIASQKRIGGTFQANMESAIGVMNELAQSREQMAGLITGISSDFPEMAKELSISSGDVGASMDSIMSDPLTFAKNMQKLNDTLAEGDPRALRLRLALSKMGPSFQYLVQGGKDSAKALEAASVPVKVFGGEFKKMIKGASGSTRTFGERMELMKDQFDNSLRGMTKQTDDQVVKRQGAAYAKLTKKIDKLRKQGGPKGFLTRAFLDIRRHGLIHGLIPSLEEASKKMGLLGQNGTLAKTRFGAWVPVLGDAAEGLKNFAIHAGPTLGALTHMGVLKPVEKVLTGVGKGAAFAVKAPFKLLGKLASSGVAGTLTDLGTSLSSFGSTAMKFVRVGGPIALLAGLGYLIYKNWDLIEPAVMAVWAALKPVVKEIGDGLAPAWQELKAIGMETWDSLKVGLKIVWDDYLVPFGKWFKANLPAMIAAGAVAIIKSISYLKFGFKYLGIQAAATIDYMQTGWKFIATVIENRVMTAFDRVAGTFDSMFTAWDLGFLTIKEWLTRIPLEMTKMIQKIASSDIGKKLLSMAGFDVSGITKGIDESVAYFTKENKGAMDALDDRKRESALMDQANIARNADRERQEQAALAKYDESRAHGERELAGLAATRDAELAAADAKMGNIVDDINAAQAARNAPTHVVPPEVRRNMARRRRGTVVAPSPAASPMAARQAASTAARHVTAGGFDLNSVFKEGVEFTEKGQKQIEEVATAVVHAAKKRMPRASQNGGGDQVP